MVTRQRCRNTKKRIVFSVLLPPLDNLEWFALLLEAVVLLVVVVVLGRVVARLGGDIIRAVVALAEAPEVGGVVGVGLDVVAAVVASTTE